MVNIFLHKDLYIILLQPPLFYYRKFQTYTKVDKNLIIPSFNNYQLIANHVSFIQHPFFTPI